MLAATACRLPYDGHLDTASSSMAVSNRTLIAKTLTAASLMAAGIAGSAHAQGCSLSQCRETNVVSVRVGTILRLGLDGSPAVVATPTRSSSMGPTVTVRSNGRWRLLVSAATEAWTPAEDAARPDKPASDLLWSIVSDGDFSSLSTAPAVAATGGSTGGTRVPFYYRARFAPDAAEQGTYTMVVRYTLTSS